ncbi:MAG TPA: hypothetical protein VK698_18050 [Kofleriaceae bacterium]|nr:hypothetical protein [Kofleriaceae bacterium]
MLLRAIRLAENLAILSLLTGSAVAMRVSAARARRPGRRDAADRVLPPAGE